jgi:hypothetical protein
MPEVKFFASLDFDSICLFMADKIHTLTIDTFESAVEDEIRDVRILFFLTPHGAAGAGRRNRGPARCGCCPAGLKAWFRCC